MAYARFEEIAVALDGKILRMELAKPDKRNIINDDVNRQLTDCLNEAALDPDVHVVLLSGQGKDFCAGGDIVRMQKKIDDPGLFYRGIQNSRRLVFAALDCPKPIVAKVQGNAVGLGATLALMCDVVVADEEAKFLDPHVNVGLVAGDGGALIWPQLIGFARAKRHLLFGDPISGKQAEEFGLIAHAVPAAELDDLAEKLAGRLARGAAQSIWGTKITMNAPLRQAAHALLDIGMGYEGLSNISKDHQEAVSAFMEKRKPSFSGD